MCHISMLTIYLDLMHSSAEKQSSNREETLNETALSHLTSAIQSGWPDKIQDVPSLLREYWSYRDELAVENGIIFKGRQVLIPPNLRQDLLNQLHSSNKGI